MRPKRACPAVRRRLSSHWGSARPGGSRRRSGPGQLPARLRASSSPPRTGGSPSQYAAIAARPPRGDECGRAAVQHAHHPARPVIKSHERAAVVHPREQGLGVRQKPVSVLGRGRGDMYAVHVRASGADNRRAGRRASKWLAPSGSSSASTRRPTRPAQPSGQSAWLGRPRPAKRRLAFQCEPAALSQP